MRMLTGVTGLGLIGAFHAGPRSGREAVDHRPARLEAVCKG
ncbi:hypothetical protein [Streptomyces sp. Ag109_O5-1]|nr:hypothetical protein [Streptomyces sp. Ag109_O5-1]